MTPNELVEQALILDACGNVGELLVEADRQIAAWREARAVVEEHLVLLMDSAESKQFMVDGLALFQRTNSSSRRAWKHDDLWTAVRKKAMARRELDVETGEVQTEADAVTAAFRECAQVSGWKVGGLERYGLDVDEFCETTWRPGVRITKAE